MTRNLRDRGARRFQTTKAGNLFRITARTVLELGAELISSDIIAFYELIKNGFDAGSPNGVEIRFDILLPRHTCIRLRAALADPVLEHSIEDHKLAIEAALLAAKDKTTRESFTARVKAARSTDELSRLLDEIQNDINRITVVDSGSGMSLNELNDNFLVIGTPSRKREVDLALTAGAESTPFLGEKGIGRLSAMRLGERLRVETARSTDSHMNLLDIDWKRFADVDAMLDQVPVSPKIGGPKPSRTRSGTSIVVSDLLENWTQQRVMDMCSEDFAKLVDPFEDTAKRPRIAIYWNGERISIPFMPASLLRAAHASVKGRYEVVDGRPLLTTTVDVIDLGFDHPPESETISIDLTDLQGAIVGKDDRIQDSALESVGDFSFQAHWFNRRRLTRVDASGENKALRDLQNDWSGILLFRDGFRVFPYGEEEDDWLELDRRALRRSGYTLNKTQFVGRVSVTRSGNPNLVDQTNREGLRVTPEQEVLLAVVRFAIQERLGQFMRAVERQYKGQKIDLSDAKTRVSSLEARAKIAIRQLRQLGPPEARESINQLQQTLLEFSEFAAQARERIAEVEKEGRQMVEMAGVGLLVEVVAHELARASENSLKVLNRLDSKEVPVAARAQLSTLKSEMKSISKRVRILDPLSVSGRQRTETFSLNDQLVEIVEAHEAQFERHHVAVQLDLPTRKLQVRAVRGMLVQILENLISNSIYWMDMRRQRDPGYEPAISITLESNPPLITFEDNGRGISPDNRDKVFQPFFSLKESSRRRGLGLYIAKDAAEHHGGSLTLSDHVNSETRRLHRFVLELPSEIQQ